MKKSEEKGKQKKRKNFKKEKGELKWFNYNGKVYWIHTLSFFFLLLKFRRRRNYFTVEWWRRKSKEYKKRKKKLVQNVFNKNRPTLYNQLKYTRGVTLQRYAVVFYPFFKFFLFLAILRLTDWFKKNPNLRNGSVNFLGDLRRAK